RRLSDEPPHLHRNLQDGARSGLGKPGRDRTAERRDPKGAIERRGRRRKTGVGGSVGGSTPFDELSRQDRTFRAGVVARRGRYVLARRRRQTCRDRKSTRLNSSHGYI